MFSKTSALGVLLLGLASLSIRAPLVRAGGSDVGNGGDVVFCATPVARAEMLDLYEGRELYGLKIQQLRSVKLSDENLARKMIEKIDRVDPHYYEWVATELEKVLKMRRYLSPNTALTPIPDSGHPIFPRNCRVTQLANYIDNFGILIDRKYWGLLDITNRAAATVHEAVYKIERELNNAQNSIVSRRIVAFLFSTTELNADLWPKIRSTTYQAKYAATPSAEIPLTVLPTLEHDFARGRCTTKLELRNQLRATAPHGLQTRFIRKIEFPMCASGYLYLTDSNLRVRDCSGSPAWSIQGGGLAMCLTGAPELPFWGAIGLPLLPSSDTPFRQCDTENNYLIDLLNCE